MRILLAGGAGFVGSHLAARLLSHGHHVIVVHNLITGRWANVRRIRAQGFGSRLEFCVADVCRPPRVDAAPQVHPQPETYWGNVNPVGPRSVYDEAKRYAEAKPLRGAGLEIAASTQALGLERRDGGEVASPPL